LKKMRGFSDDIPIGILPLGDPLDALPLAKEIRAVSMNPNYRAIKNEVVDMLHDAGLKVYPYTVNEKEDIDKVKSYGVDGIITNYPERVK
jgi:glycerophosphoryl diester phosphodiesterase